MNKVRLKQPLVSIIVPIYNVERYLDRCVQSILNQTYKNLEIILVNDGSPDGCGAMCDDYTRQDSRVAAIHQDNGGVSKARNAGLEAMTGHWILFTDGDDLLPHDAVEVLLQAAQETKADCVAGGYYTFNNDDSIGGLVSDTPSQIKILDKETAISNMLYQRQIANAPFTKLFKADIVRGIRFSDNIVVAEDLLFNYHVLRNTRFVALIDYVVYLYRDREGSAINKRFAHSRMTGLEATAQILADAEKQNKNIRPAKNRFFMEAVFVGVQIVGEEIYAGEYNQCKAIIKKYRFGVMGDRSSPITYRIVAAMACINIALALHMVRSRSSRRSR